MNEKFIADLLDKRAFLSSRGLTLWTVQVQQLPLGTSEIGTVGLKVMGEDDGPFPRRRANEEVVRFDSDHRRRGAIVQRGRKVGTADCDRDCEGECEQATVGEDSVQDGQGPDLPSALVVRQWGR